MLFAAQLVMRNYYLHFIALECLYAMVLDFRCISCLSTEFLCFDLHILCEVLEQVINTIIIPFIIVEAIYLFMLSFLW